MFSVPEDKGLDWLDLLVAGNVPKIRFGRVLHTFMADAQGRLVADCYVANNDREFVFLCESIVPDAELDTLLTGADWATSGAEELASTHVLLSLDGLKAWEIVKKIFGADVLGLPYLSIENYSFAGQPVRLLRAGKTSEFGYLLLVPQAAAAALFDTCKAEVLERSGQLCGVDVHDGLRLEGRFFNVHAEGLRVRDPLPLGLQWMVDFSKDNFSGAEEIRKKRAGGLRQKLVGLAGEPGCVSLTDGARIFLQGRDIGEIVASCFSGVLGHRLGLAVLPVEVAYSGLRFQLGEAEGPVVRSISMPPIMPKSLGVKLDEM
jgi:aminomethyltransferase